MKRQIKAIAIALAILTTTACGTKEAKVEDVNVAEEQQQAEVALGNVRTPQATLKATDKKENAVKEDKENKEDKKENNKSYIIPQTLEVKEKEAKADDKAAEENKEVAYQEVSQENESAKEVVNNTVEEKTNNNNYDDATEVFVGADDEEEVIEAKEEKEVKEYKVASKDDQAVNYFAEENTEIEADYEQVAPSNTIKAVEAEKTVVSAPAEIKEEVSTIEDNQVIEEEVEEEVKEEIHEEKVEAKEEAPVAPIANQSKGLTLASPSIEEIRAYWKNYQTRANDTAELFGLNLINPESSEMFSSNANLDLNNIDLGALSQAAQEDALHIANTARYASGIKNELVAGQSQAQYAQAASLVNALNDEISHSPSQVNGLDSNIYQLASHGAANANLASNYGLLDSVLGYLRDDLGETNQTQVGHRRWVLNPAETVVGFGQVDAYSAMYVNNNQYDGENDDLVYAYPGQTAISEFHSEEASLSLMFGENFDITNAQVSVTDLQTGEVRNDAHIDQSLKGWVKTITFGQGMNFQPGTKLQVKVTGVTKDGAEYPVEYTIEYASIN